jgi:hypothetical protein
MKLPLIRLNMLSSVLNWLETDDESISVDSWQFDLALLRAELKQLHPFVKMRQDEIDAQLAQAHQAVADELYPDLP